MKKTIPYEMKKLGTYLKQLRKESELSIREVAEKSRIAPSYLFKIENGNSFFTINIHTLLKLSKFYNIPVGALLKEAGLVDSDEYELPDLPQYLRAKYHLSPQAIRDIEMAKEIVDKKYKNLPR
ncbi:MAG: helix-turn-helix transcriptional regulator [Minisyncoccales bacterium]